MQGAELDSSPIILDAKPDAKPDANNLDEVDGNGRLEAEKRNRGEAGQEGEGAGGEGDEAATTEAGPGAGAAAPPEGEDEPTDARVFLWHLPLQRKQALTAGIVR